MPESAIQEPIRAENYKLLRQHVYFNTGIVLDGDKRYLFESRLAPLVRKLGLGSINDLCALLAATRESDVGRQVMEAMTTNETYFFRDPAHYTAIRTVLLPRLKSLRASRTLRFWSAGCSTGQEAFTLAMLLLEEGFGDWKLDILGTDISSQVVERARLGKFQQIEVNRGLPAARLVKYFERCGIEWQLNETVRRMVRFQTMDLRQSLRALGPFDLVFCRNVLIYFDGETKKKILEELHGTLFRDAWLLLGGAETAFGVEARFDRQTVAGATVYVAR